MIGGVLLFNKFMQIDKFQLNVSFGVPLQLEVTICDFKISNSAGVNCPEWN
jgi:hypothetical protein